MEIDAGILGWKAVNKVGNSRNFLGKIPACHGRSEFFYFFNVFPSIIPLKGLTKLSSSSSSS